MQILDPGHAYLIECLEGAGSQTIYFVKREGENYPGNTNHHDGPITQEYLRAIIHRMKYMRDQGACYETDIIIDNLRSAILAFEVRAARCRGTSIVLAKLSDIDDEPTCPICGHIQCDITRHDKPHWSEENPVTKHGG